MIGHMRWLYKQSPFHSSQIFDRKIIDKSTKHCNSRLPSEVPVVSSLPHHKKALHDTSRTGTIRTARSILSDFEIFVIVTFYFSQNGELCKTLIDKLTISAKHSRVSGVMRWPTRDHFSRSCDCVTSQSRAVSWWLDQSEWRTLDDVIDMVTTWIKV